VSTLDFTTELAAAGANVKTRWGAIRYFVRRYPLGAAGGVIMAVFVLAAIFAPYLTSFDPLSTNAAASLAKPPWWPGATAVSASHWLGCDFMGRSFTARASR
jgi:peptide/nickel transport system permease protein